MPKEQNSELRESCRKKPEPARMHEHLANVLLEAEKRDKQLYAGRDQKKRLQLPSLQIPFIP
jgi:hypothetical protein